MKKFPQKQLFGVADLIAESLAVLRQCDKDHIPLNVAFSGGKDSIVLAALVELSGLPYQLVYRDTTIDPPDVRAFIKKHYPNTIFARPKKTFWQYMVEKFPPSIRRRWCCKCLKHGTDKSNFVVTGIRREESVLRSKYQHFQYRSKQLNVHPILNWPEWAIWEFITVNGLPYPEIYDAGINRVGCVICPFRKEKMHLIWKSRYPKYFRVFETCFKKWLIEKKGYDLAKYDYQKAIDDWYRNNGIVHYEHYDWRD